MKQKATLERIEVGKKIIKKLIKDKPMIGNREIARKLEISYPTFVRNYRDFVTEERLKIKF